MATAYASLVSLMHVMHDLENHPFPPISLDKQVVDSITQHVTYFQEFLQSYNSSPPSVGDDDEEGVADPLEMRIAAAAHEAEDAIEYHIAEFIKPKRNNKTTYADKKIKSMRCGGILQTVIEEMDSINEVVVSVDTQMTKQMPSLVDLAMRDHDVSPASNETLVGSDGVLLMNMEQLATWDNKTNDANEKIKSNDRCGVILQTVIEEMYSIKKLVVLVDTQAKQKSSLVNVVHDQVAMRDHDVFPASGGTLVGSNGVLLEIIEKLVGPQLDLWVIPIVGMGGIGKTFLAKTIYAEPLVKDRFDICAWATISQNYDETEILCELLSQATKTNEQLSGTRADELGLKLHKRLLCRRYLIVMDDMWSIDSWNAIQSYFPNNDNGSRVLVTTRQSQLSLQLSNDYILNMSVLDKDSSWDLFSKTVFGDKSSCPPELVEIGKKIVNNCRGLPLSIAVVGGFLRKLDGSRSSWELIRDNFTSVVNMNNHKHCLNLLKLSYNHLPVYLKPCFLYMGVFEEDEVIHVPMLVQLWVSEGFVRPTSGETLETTARGFLQDLIDRNLILIGGLGPTGGLESCKIHDLVRDMCLKESRKERFYPAMEQCNPPHRRSRYAQHPYVILKSSLKKRATSGVPRFMSRTRSIICDHAGVALYHNLLLLRTLHARNKSIIYNDYRSLKSLVSHYVNLRHLAVKVSFVGMNFPSFSQLWNLQTLVVHCDNLYWSPLLSNLWKMPQFRHIEFIKSCTLLPDPPIDDAVVVVMENLHTLKGIRNFKCSEGVVKRIPNIKNMKLEYDTRDYDRNDYLVSMVNIKNLCGLEVLSVKFLSARAGGPITFPHSLKKLNLCLDHELEWDDGMLEKIGSLPLLEELILSKGRFKREEWEIGQGQFPSLKYLEIRDCLSLKNLRMGSVEDNSSAVILPRLEHLKLEDLDGLMEIPFELGNIVTLETIKLICCQERAVRSLKEMFDEQVELLGGEDQLGFHVEIQAGYKLANLLSLASPKFYVGEWKWFP